MVTLKIRLVMQGIWKSHLRSRPHAVMGVVHIHTGVHVQCKWQLVQYSLPVTAEPAAKFERARLFLKGGPG
jgi:hypothetical protein